MKRSYGTFLNTAEIKGQIDAFQNSLKNAKADPTKFNRSSANNVWNAINTDIKNKAGQEGITSVSTMYSKLIALIKEESNVKLKAYKINGEDTGLMEEKLELIQKQKAELQSLLDKYNLLTNAQKESLETEQKKADATYESGKALYDKSLSDTGSGIDENLLKPSNRFFSAFNRGNDGVIAQLNNLESKLYGVRYAFEGVIALAGGRKLYDWIIGSNAQIETLQKSMEVVMHSAEKAADTIQELRSYAALTTFQETETFQAGETLSANRMDVNKWIRISGDLAAAKQPQGIELNDVINVVTRINSGDFGKAMIRLRQLGISLSDFRAQGLEFSKNNTYLGTTSEMLDALEKIVNQRYGGMTEVLGNTVSGSISTIKDYFTQIGIDLGGGVFSQFSNALQKWKKELQEFRDSPEFQQIIENFNKAFNTLKDFLAPVGSALKDIILLVAKFLPEIATAIKMLTMIKLSQGFFKGLDTLQANWKKVTAQQELQKQLIAQAGEATILENTAANRLHDTLAKIVAMRKLGLQYAEESAAADAVAAGNIQSRGVKFAKKNYTNAAKEVADDVVEKATTDAAKAAATRAAAAKASLAGTGAEAAMAGSGASVAGTLGLAAMAVPIAGMLIGTIRNALESQAKYTSEDYKRIASEKMNESSRLGEVNLQRQTARAQIDFYSNNVNNTKSEVERTRAALDINPTDKQALDDYNNAVHRNAEALDSLTSAQQQLRQANQQILNIAPELASTLIDQEGALTDNTQAFKDNTDAINENIRNRKLEIARKKEEELQAAKSEAAKAKKQISDNNTNINFAKNTNRGFAIFEAIAFNLVGTVTDALNISDVVGINKPREAYELAAQNKEDKELTINSLNVDNNKLRGSIDNASELERQAQEARNRKFLIKGTDEIDWESYLKQKEREERNNTNYLLEDEGVATRANEIQSNGEGQLENVKNAYQVKLNEIKKRHGGKTDSKEYTDMMKARNEALKSVGDEILAELETIERNNNDMMKTALSNAQGSTIQTVAELMEQNADISVSDIRDAVEQLRSNGDAIIVGKLHEHQDAIREFFKLGLGGMADNLNLYSQQLDELERINNNRDTITNEINKAKLRIDSLTEDKDTNSKSALQTFNDEWERKRQMAQTQKEIALQQQQMRENYEGTQAYKNTRNEQDHQIRSIILDEIAGLNRLLASGSLTEEDTWQARKQIADLQKEANELALEIDDRLNKDALGAFHEKWDTQNSIEEAKRDLALQQDELNGFDSQSTKYLNDQKSLNMGIRDRLLSQAQELRELIPKLDSKAQLEATLQEMQLQKEANQILLDIKKNTQQFGEFNKPSFVKAMTYYDYMTQDSQARSIEIGSADFVFKIDAPQTEEDIQNLMALVESSLGQHIASNDRRGVVNPNTRG
jgi:hypothetical protein